MADGHHLENGINCYISATVWPILMKFCTLMNIGPPDTKGCPKFGTTMHISPPPDGLPKIKKNENPRWQTVAILKIEKSRYLRNRLADFDKILHDDTQLTSCSKYQFIKPKMADGRHYKKREMRYLCSRLTDFLMKFGMKMHRPISPPNLTANHKFENARWRTAVNQSINLFVTHKLSQQ